MTPEIWIAYFTTLVLFMVSPGPSHLLMLSNSMRHGFPKSMATAYGDLAANTLQIAIAALGLVSVLHNSQSFFLIVKWAGVAYLVYLGIIRILRRKETTIADAGGNSTLASLFGQGFLTSAANPKAIIFFAALLPQFIDPASPAALQFFVLGLTYIVVDGLFLGTYGYFAGWLGSRFTRENKSKIGWISGGAMILAAFLLGLKEIEPN